MTRLYRRQRRNFPVGHRLEAVGLAGLSLSICGFAAGTITPRHVFWQLPAGHPAVATDLNNLALILRALRQAEAARPLQERGRHHRGPAVRKVHGAWRGSRPVTASADKVLGYPRRALSYAIFHAARHRGLRLAVLKNTATTSLTSNGIVT